MEDIKNTVIKHIKKEKKIQTAVGEIAIEKTFLGQGGNGVVYECKLGGIEGGKKSFAIKFLTIINSKEKTDRFISEFFNVSTLPTNNFIIKNISFDRITIDDKIVPLILMKKYETNLKDFRKKIGKPSFNELEKLFKFLIQSVKFIHENGVIHRDLKPENILIDEFGDYVIADFGIAKFNPEMFSLSPKTKDTRLGNRIFSAPEQSENNAKAHETMDIWAIGQILQWFVTGETHHGIGRSSISNFYESSFSFTIDQIIDKCLQHNIANRFKNFSEIEAFIEYSKFTPYYNYDYYINQFHFALNYAFPKGINKLNFSSSKEKVNILLEKISQIRTFKDPVWKEEKIGMININSNQLQYEFEDGKWNDLELTNENGIWILNHFEIKIIEFWCYFDNTAYNDFLILHVEGMPPFGIYPEYQIEMQEENEFEEAKHLNYLDFESAGFVDDQYYISTEEVDAGYAEIEGKTIILSEHKVSLRSRCLKDLYILIGTKHHTYFSPFLNRYEKVDKITSDFISNFRLNIPNIETPTNEFLAEIRKLNNKHKQYLYSIRDLGR